MAFKKKTVRFILKHDYDLILVLIHFEFKKKKTIIKMRL